MWVVVLRGSSSFKTDDAVTSCVMVAIECDRRIEEWGIKDILMAPATCVHGRHPGRPFQSYARVPE
eukprot:48929-Eustigmatos_ZCMA.PRE.1